MIRRPLLVAFAFAASALALFGALARITSMTLALERSEMAALQRATHEENVRIALWRIDAMLAELIALENTRPAVRFRSAAEPAGLLLLAAASSPETYGPERVTPVALARVVRARFEIGADRRLRAEPPAAEPFWAASLPIPEPPPRSKRRRAAVAAAETVIAESAEPPAQETAARDDAIEPAAPKDPDPSVLLQQTSNSMLDQMNLGGNESGQQSPFTQEALNNFSFQRRQELGRQSNLVRPPSAPPGVEVESAFEGRWMGGDLVLLRHVRRGDARLLQGTWLDWPALSAFLLAQVEAFAPASRLEPLDDSRGAGGAGHISETGHIGAIGHIDDTGRRLALLPARLIPGPMLETEPRDWTPLRLSLAAAWVAALLGLVGIGSLLKSSVTLSQRRADFVSAVTHELRTPLTTFRLYSDMLAEGIVPAEERPSYLVTLKREADRLGRLVDNVLSFSRLERRAPALQIESLALAELLARVVPGLEERAGQAGLTLQVEAAPGLRDERVRADVASVEQILLNLVDNACKYAPNPARPTLHLAAALRGRHAILRLHDHGPGIERRERRRIFRPFHRPATRAAGSAPGVGLGLALSRRLARRMGGDLRLAGSEDGASFELRLRRG